MVNKHFKNKYMTYRLDNLGLTFLVDFWYPGHVYSFQLGKIYSKYLIDKEREGPYVDIHPTGDK